MGRPRKSEAARERLIEAGMRRISAHGVTGTGLNALLEEAGIARGSFYNFYASKEAFLEAVVKAYTSRLLGMFDQVFEDSTEGAPPDRLAAAHHVLVDLIEQNDHAAGCLLGTVGSEVCTTLPDFRPVLDSAFNAWRERLRALLEEGQADGSVRTDLPASQLASLFLATWQGALILMRVEKSTRPVVEALETALTLLRPPEK